MSKLAADFPKLVIDQNAETFSELLEDWPMSQASLEIFCRKKIASGEWERVKKKAGTKLVSAYRRAK